MLYAEIEPFGMDEGDFRAMVLNSTIAAVAGAKDLNPTAFTMRAFVEAAAAEGVKDRTEETLDALFGIAPRSADEKQLDALLRVN